MRTLLRVLIIGSCLVGMLISSAHAYAKTHEKQLPVNGAKKQIKSVKQKILKKKVPAPAKKTAPQKEAVSPQSQENVRPAPSVILGKSKVPKVAFAGAVLAGSTAPLLDFHAADYESALASGKLVVLYFYANWCPVCVKETENALYPAFTILESPNVVGFRVNYNDNKTDAAEKKLASQFGVLYQHTKVFLKNGKPILTTVEAWDKERYGREIMKYLNQ